MITMTLHKIDSNGLYIYSIILVLNYNNLENYGSDVVKIRSRTL